jgi:hypothetical protein
MSSCLAKIRKEGLILHSFFVGSQNVLGYGKLHVLLDAKDLPEYRIYTADLNSGYVNDNYTPQSVYDYPDLDYASRTPSVRKVQAGISPTW